MNGGSSSSSELKAQGSLWMVLAVILLFAPLFRAGNRPLPLMALEIAALVLLVIYWIPGSGRRELSIAEVALVGGILFVPLLQFIPLPPALWAEMLPGRAFYAEGLRHALGEASFFENWRPLTLTPYSTEAAWLALLLPVAVFLTTRNLSSQLLQRLIYLFLGIAVFQSVLGLIQYGAGPGSLFRLGNERWSGASGTYASRNHLAGLLEMALPVALALLVGTFGKSSGSLNRRKNRWKRLFSREGQRGNRSMLYAAIALVILLGIIFTRSRAGILLAMAGLLLCFFAFARRVGTREVYGAVGIVAFAGVILAFEIGLTPILNRFALMDPLQEGRWAIFAGTLQAIGEFFPLGSGSGSYREVFPRFQPEVFFGGGIYRAHNDYLEWLFVGGLAAAILIVAGILIYCRQWLTVWRGKQDSTFYFIQVGAGIGLLLLLLHTFVDFNLHIPANAIFFAFLLGVFFHPVQERRRSQRKQLSSPVEEYKPLRSREIPPENRVNPFAS